MSTIMSTDEIDGLYERYLVLLDEYTNLRERLKTQLASMHLSLARANFHQDRGVRYGQDYYDDRMQASRRVQIIMNGSEAETTTFLVGDPSNGNGKASTAETGKALKDADLEDRGNDEPEPAPDAKTQKTKPKDPLQWFGFTAPQALRDTKNYSVSVCENVVPKLVGVDAALKELEIQIRRARKHHAKSLGAAKKREVPTAPDKGDIMVALVN